MPVSRMRMRPWLEKMIDSERVPGLQWVDKNKTMFSIPWKHAARHGWELEKDASLFKLWAIHTGKHVEGQSCDPKTWKANFRCAMNSLPDIEEVKDKSINKGHQAMRVFKLLPITPKSRDKRCRMGKLRKTQVKYEEDSSDSDSVPSPIELPQQSPQDNRVDRTMFTDSQDGRYPSPVEVPDWSSMVEIGSESYNHRFQVSPSHSMCDDPYTDKMIEICEELESERQWMNLGLENRGFLSNETCTSPGSQWSEGSSADELDELPRTEYTLLNTSYTATSAEHIWSNLLML